MNKKDLELMSNHIEKTYRIFIVITALISVIELMLMLRGAFMFNLDRLKLRLYLYSYIFLFLSSITAFVFLIAFHNTQKHIKKLTAMTYIYAFLLVTWSTFVTCIDCYANGDSGIVVYLTACIAVGVLTLIKPIFFISILGTSSIILLCVSYFARGKVLYSSGFYINFLIFLALAIFINAHNYHLSLREYEVSIKLKNLSYTDQLTGVYNRRRLDNHMSSNISDHKSFIFVLLDIDDFKSVNDTFGHPMGDNCLVVLAQKLSDKFGDHVYRFGGDEFAIISKLDEGDVCKKIDEINSELGSAFSTVDLHISAGIYKTSADDSLGEIFIHTDRALYNAKNDGKCKWSLYISNDKESSRQ